VIPIVTVAQMRALDEEAISHDLTKGYSYMLKAGTGLFDAVRTMLPDRDGEIAVVCGKGNNGGDGYVAARLLLEAGRRVMCFSLCAAEELQGEARIAFNEYIESKGNFLILDDTGELASLSRYRLIIDAMLGTGARNDPHGLCAMAIEAINESKVPVIAVDTPSGLNNDTGMPGSPCIRATVTVTMGFPKIGLFFYPGRSYAGRLAIQELGYPDELVESWKPSLFFPAVENLSGILPPRKPAGSKFDHGLALLLAGSRGMAGSATLVANAAMRTGCGMTHLAAPESIIPALACKLTETVLHPIPETAAGTASLSAMKFLREKASGMQALCVGPGLSHNEETGELVRELVANVTLPAVLDADGLNAYKGRSGELGRHGGDLIITPHRGEWQRLFGDLPEAPLQRIDLLKEKAAALRLVVLLKGAPSIVADPLGSAWILPFGNSCLAKAGSGDVLSGIIVSLLAQGAEAAHAAILGAWLLGETGELASRRLGEYSVTASDVVGSLHCAIGKLNNRDT